jgi:hypothetical protein
MTWTPVLEAVGLSKRYGRTLVLDDHRRVLAVLRYLQG